MSAEAAFLVRSFRVGHRTCTWTVPPIRPGAVLHMAVDWSPDTPRWLAPFEWRQYAAGRAMLMREVADIIGGSVAVVDL